MSTKVYLNYEGEPKEDTPEIRGARLGREELKLKTSLPAKWSTEPCLKVLDLFVTHYNKKFPEKPLVIDDMELRVGGIILQKDEKISNCIREYADVYVQHKKRDLREVVHAPGSLACTNYGCGQRYFEEENNETACKHHVSPPVFWDTVKFWGCCADHKAMDFEDFQKIETCSTGRHNSTPKTLFKKPVEQSISNVPLTEGQIAANNAAAIPLTEQPVGTRTCGPREFDNLPTKPQQIIDGKANCRNFGCGKKFVVEENHEEACTYHSGGPVFWDTSKYWSCCPDQKHYEFDDFAKVKGCTVGPHKL